MSPQKKAAVEVRLGGSLECEYVIDVELRCGGEKRGKPLPCPVKSKGPRECYLAVPTKWLESRCELLAFAEARQRWPSECPADAPLKVGPIRKPLPR